MCRKMGRYKSYRDTVNVRAKKISIFKRIRFTEHQGKINETYIVPCEDDGNVFNVNQFTIRQQRVIDNRAYTAKNFSEVRS